MSQLSVIWSRCFSGTHLAGESGRRLGYLAYVVEGHAHGQWALVRVCGVDVSHVYGVKTKRTANVQSNCREEADILYFAENNVYHLLF